MTSQSSGIFGLAVAAILLAGFPVAARAQVDCSTFPVGPSRTDCYINVSRAAGLQSDVAAAKARVQSDAAAYRQVAGTSGSKARKGRRRQPASGHHPPE
jgi:hypothetical protein